GSGAAEAGDRAHDHARIDLQEPVRAETKLGGAGGAKVLQHDVALAHQLLKKLRTFRPGQVQRDTALVAIATEEVGTERAGEWRAPGAGIVAAARPFDLDDLGPQVAKHLAAERSRQNARRIQHADAGQGPVRVGVHEGSLWMQSFWPPVVSYYLPWT